MIAQGPRGIMWGREMTKPSVNGHKKEPELKRPGHGTSRDLEGPSGWHDPYMPEW